MRRNKISSFGETDVSIWIGGASVPSTTSRGAVHISLQGLYCSCKPLFYCHVTFTGYPLHSLVSPSLLLPCVTVCHHISTGLYYCTVFPIFLSSIWRMQNMDDLLVWRRKLRWRSAGTWDPERATLIPQEHGRTHKVGETNAFYSNSWGCEYYMETGIQVIRCLARDTYTCIETRMYRYGD